METKLQKTQSVNYQHLDESSTVVPSFVKAIKPQIHQPYLIFKRFLDVVFSVIILLITAPIMLIAMFFILVDSPGGVFFSQERVGLMGRNFKVYKLRSMRQDAEASGAQWAKVNDNRVTRVGSFLRRTRIDELPQLWNVLVGDMSLIGPRPERPVFTSQFVLEVPGFEQRLRVKPGLSGLAQIHGGYNITPAQKLRIDLFYCAGISFIADFKIFFGTIKTIFTGEGAR